MVYKWYFFCQLGDYMPPTTLYGNQKTTIDITFEHKEDKERIVSEPPILFWGDLLVSGRVTQHEHPTNHWFIHGCFQKEWYPQIIHLFIGFSIIFTIQIFGGFSTPIFGNIHIGVNQRFGNLKVNVQSSHLWFW